MEVSQTIKSTQYPTASPDGRHIALLANSRLEFRSVCTLHLLRSIAVGSSAYSTRWSPICHDSKLSSRVLVADEENIKVWDLLDEKWTSTISNGSGGMGKIVNTEFGKSKDEVLVFSDFGSKVTIWNLKSARTVEIRDPKFSTRGFGFRPSGGIFALLSRPGAQDTLTLHAPETYAVLKTTVLPTVDAQGLKWSSDGRWLAVWDTTSIGYKVYIYTADGHLYRIYNGDVHDDGMGLGIKSIEWSPRGDYLAIGGHDRRVTLLSSRTFSPIMFLDHTPSIQLTNSHSVWEEQVSASSERFFTAVTQPVAPPVASPSATDHTPRTGMSVILFNANGTMVATRGDSAPTTVWLWDLSKLAAHAVLIQHSPIRAISWHPTLPSLLLIQSIHEEPIIYIYDCSQNAPFTVPLTHQKSTNSGRLEVRWLNTPSSSKPALLFGDAGSFLVAWPDGKDVILRFEDQEDDSEDSLFEILTGRSPRKMVDSTEVLVSDVLDEDTEVMDDTFIRRRGVNVFQEL